MNNKTTLTSINDNQDTNKDNEDSKIQISKQTIDNTFVIMVIISLITNFDNGIIPCSTKEISQSIKENQSGSKLGFLGSADYLGRIIASLIYLSIINKINRKNLLIITLLIKAISSILVIPFNSIYLLLCIIRIINGSAQIYFTIYLPIWCDQFGDKNNRTMMIASIQLGLPFGIVFGYGLCLILKRNWVLSFTIEGFLLIVCCLLVYYIDNTLFDQKLVKEENENENENGILKNFKITELKDEKSTLFVNLKIILKNPIFLIITLGISLSYFIMGALKFWGPDYLDFQFHNKYDIAYLIITFTGPTLGIVLGGLSGTYVGGYASKKAIIVCLIFAIISCVVGIFTSLTKNPLAFFILLWSYFFFGTGVVPIGTGIVINCVNNDIKGDAVSINNFVQNLIGNLPPTYVYGIIKEKFNHNIAIRFTFLIGVVNSVNLLCGAFITYFCSENNEKNEKEVTFIDK